MADSEQDDADVLENDQEGSYCEDGVRRPMNAFFIFCKRHRDVVREKYPHLENRSITKILGEWWASLDAPEKSSYTALAKQYKEAFMKAHPDFKWYKLPTVPTRTLVTRPSNNRCLQTVKKDKAITKSSCGIALGKLADDEHLGGLSSLLLSNSVDSSASVTHADCNNAIACPVTSTSSSILKPPKKRYLVNGEFMCKSESKTYDGRDDQTQNACSALLELAEICVNTASHSLPTSKQPDEKAGNSCLYTSSVTSCSNANFSNSLLTLKKVSNNAISPSECDSVLPTASSASFIKPIVSACSSTFLSHNVELGVGDLQEQPLNLCKQKGKTFTASNQQLIDHLVDKFLCEPPSSQIKASLEPQVTEYKQNKQPICNKTKLSCQSFTLSAAIESAIDQAYSKELNLQPSEVPEVKSASVICKSKNSFEQGVSKSPQSKTTDDSVDETTEVVFIDKIKKACLASSWRSLEKSTPNRMSYSSYANVDGLKPNDTIVSKSEEKDTPVEGGVTKLSVQSEISCNRFNSDIIPKKSDAKFSSSKYYSKFVSPPKKSQVWCNIFMKEQLENSDSESSPDAKKSVMFDLTSPVRRNSQRTCKGRRYQALITEGLLQSSKERKPGAGRKPFTGTCKVKPSSISDPVILKSKKKKREPLGKSKLLEKDEESDSEKGVFDLNEKIASLPKCSLETLNKKRKLNTIGTASSLRPVSTVPVAEAKGAPKEPGITCEITDNSPKTQQDDSASSGRFKTGNFDLEQHIASLPKCDIEVLNKKRNKKE